MSDLRIGDEPDLRAFFSDTTEDYLIPVQPDLHESVTIRLRTGKNDADVCFLVVYGSYLRMHLVESDDCFDYYSVRLEVSESPLRYYFMIIAGGKKYRYTRRGIRNTIRPGDWWHVLPGFHPPAWAVGAIMYQIFVDRFYNGDPSNDVVDGEYMYMGRPVVKMEDWSQEPSSVGYCEFYGGDLKGVMDKLDYLQDLGVEAIYLNPIFLSPSSHKYDTQDYEHIDPHFGKIVRDIKDQKDPRAGQHSASVGRPRHFKNSRAQRYLERVTNPENLSASDKLFAKLVREAHKRGIRVILDGVFNHCGSFHRWMDAEKIYEKLSDGIKGARASKKSPYINYFRFRHDDWPSNDSYDSWWDFGTLPKLDYEKSEELCEYILEIGRKWVSPPFCADGWRLDVASDLSYSRSFNHVFWKRFRKAVKEANPEAIIIAENYMDSWKWLQGDEWDTIMNYEFFMEPVTFFLTGMEKHSDGRNEERYGDPDFFWRTVLGASQEALPAAALQISMNELSNHDHSRFLTRTNRVVGRAEDLGTAMAMEDVSMEIMRQAVLLQMTWTGAPTIYYGDEAGVGGFTDPDNRRTYPWGHEDKGLIRCHRALAAFRKNSPSLRRGSLMRLPDEDGVIAYARTYLGDGRREINIVILNINHIKIEYETNVIYTGVPSEAHLVCLFATGRKSCQARCSDSIFLEREDSHKRGKKHKKASGEHGESMPAAAAAGTVIGETAGTGAGAASGTGVVAAAGTAASTGVSSAFTPVGTSAKAYDSSDGTSSADAGANAAAEVTEAREANPSETPSQENDSVVSAGSGTGAGAAAGTVIGETAGTGAGAASEVAEVREAGPSETPSQESVSAADDAAADDGRDVGFSSHKYTDECANNNIFSKYPLRELLDGSSDFTETAQGESQANDDDAQSGNDNKNLVKKEYLPPVITVRDGNMRITLPPESGFLLRWTSVSERDLQ